MEQLKLLKSIGKLHSTLQQKASVLDDASTTVPVMPQFPELSQLWEWCSSADVHASDAACSALVSLVRSRRLHPAYVLHGMINQTPAAKNLAAVIRGVGDMLIDQLLSHSQDKPYACPYSIRQPPHPFVSILVNRPDSWPHLLQQCKRISSYPHSRVMTNAPHLLTPFIKYIMLEPAGKIGTLRTALCSLSSNPILAVLVGDCLPALPLSTSNQIGEACLLLETLFTSLTLPTTSPSTSPPPATSDPTHNTSKKNGEEEDKHKEKGGIEKHTAISWLSFSTLTRFAVEVCEASLSHGMDSQACLNLVENILYGPGINKKHATELFLSLLCLLDKVPYSQQSQVLLLLNAVLLYDDALNPIAVAMVILPALNVVAQGNPIAVEREKSTGQKAATRLLVAVNKYLAKVGDKWTSSNATMEHKKHMNEDGFAIDALAVLTDELSANQNACYKWVWQLSQGLRTSIPSCYLLSCLLGAMLIHCEEKRIIEKSLEQLVEVCRGDVEKCPNLLPFILYKMNQDPRPDVKYLLLTRLPDIATHKILLPPVLSALQRIGEGSCHMKAVSLRLVCKLWEQQDRCFPHLQHLILERESGSASGVGGIDELQLAKAACIRDICQCRPTRGADMLGALSNILNECTSSWNPTPAALALEGLYFLCEAEVIDIRTTWSALAVKLNMDTRPLVVQHVCRLFSLVPSLAVDTAEFQGFRAEVVDTLWQHSASDDHQVATAAFEALGNFSPEEFNITHLPHEVTGELLAAIEAAAAEAGYDNEPELPPVPGHFYTDLLRLLSDDRLQGYGELMKKILRQEVLALPRGISHTIARRHGQQQGDTNRGISFIPQFLKREYDQTRTPALRPALAASLLYAYDPVLPLNKEGNAKKTEVIKYGRAYLQMLSTLLHEVPLYGESTASAEWQRSLSQPAAWAAFMERCYNAYVNCRQADLVLQLEQGKANDTEENDLQQKTAWLWARDKLTDVIKSVSRGGSPHVQGNCVIALSGLAVASSAYAAGVEDAAQLEKEATAHMGQAHWLNMATHTTLALLDFTYNPPGRTFNICQQRGGGDEGISRRQLASVGARAGACMALGSLVPLLLPAQCPLVHTVLHLLTTGLPENGAEEEEVPPQLLYNYGLGLGLVLASLFNHRFAALDGSQGMVNVEPALQRLESSALEGGQSGSLLGLAATLAAMCNDPYSHDHLIEMMEMMMARLEAEGEKDSSVVQGLCLCLSAVGVGAYSMNIIDQDFVNRVVGAVYMQHSNDMQSAGICVSLGLLCHGLTVSGHATIGDLAPQLYTTWYNSLVDEQTTKDEYMVALAGCTAMAGSQHMWLQVESTGESRNTGLNLNELVKSVSEHAAASTDSDVHVQASRAWTLGMLYQAVHSAQHTRSSVPLTYSYLPDTSVLKACVQLLSEAAKKGALSQVHPVGHVECMLNALLTAPPLPPLNWSALLSPLMRGGYGPTVEWMCLKLSSTQASSSCPSAALFLASWLLTPLHNSLQVSSREKLYGCLPQLIKVIPASKLQEYLENGFIQPFTVQGNNKVCQSAALGGLAAALKVNDPPQNVTSLLYAALERLYALTTDKQLSGLCLCMQQVPDTMVLQLIDVNKGDEIPEEEVDYWRQRELYVRTWLVAQGTQPLTWISGVIEDALMQTQGQRHEESLKMLLESLVGWGKEGKSIGAVSTAVMGQQWLLELMGYIRHVASPGGSKTSDEDDELKQQDTEALPFVFAVFSAAVLSWSKSAASITLPALRGIFSTRIEADTTVGSKKEEKKSEIEEKSWRDVAFFHEKLGEVLLGLLPTATVSLLASDGFKVLTCRVLEWLIGLCSLPEIQKNALIHGSIISTIHLLRHSKEFSVGSVWGRVFSLKPAAVC